MQDVPAVQVQVHIFRQDAAGDDDLGVEGVLNASIRRCLVSCRVVPLLARDRQVHCIILWTLRSKGFCY